MLSFISLILAWFLTRNVHAVHLHETVTAPLKVLVFGDSWGALGPSWRTLTDMFAGHGVSAQVKSTAVSGTMACQWAQIPQNLASAANREFPGTGPDFIWLTTGGNDLLTEEYKSCSLKSKTYDEALVCATTQAEKSRKCNEILLDKLYAVFPKTQVFQCGYDFQCAAGNCIPSSRWPYCGHNVSCTDTMGRKWARKLLKPLDRKFGEPRYKSIAIDGACQKAGNVPRADIGNPNMKRGSPCKLMLGCEHPAPGSIAAYTIGEAFWNLYFKDRVPGSKDPSLAHLPPIFKPVPGWDTQIDTDVEDTICNKDWVPNLEEKNIQPPPCNRTFESVR